jgi:hypothetical protein
MKEKAQFITLPALLLLIFFLGKLILSITGASYQTGVQVFSMVTLQIHLALIWPAVGRRYKGHGIGGAIQVGLMIVLVSQILIIVGTIVSYPMGGTHFNFPTALNQDAPVGFMTAMGIRAGGLVANCVFGIVAAVIGWTMGTLIPSRPEGGRQAAS